MIKKINFKIPFGKYVWKFCRLKYPGHPKGCPNFGKKKGCPPNAVLIDKVLDLEKQKYLIYTEFDVKKFARKMKKKHKGWSEKQTYNCLYWQGKARKEHNAELERIKKKLGEKLKDEDKMIFIKYPEANGVDVVKLMKKMKLNLDWPARKIVRIVSLAGTRR